MTDKYNDEIIEEEIRIQMIRQMIMNRRSSVPSATDPSVRQER